MKTKAYVDVNQADNPQTWYSTAFAQVVDHPTAINYEDLVDRTKEVAAKVLDPDVAAEYVERFCHGEGLIATNPIDGTQVNITEDTSFAEELEEAGEEMEDVLSTPLWGTSEDADDEAVEEEAAEAPEDDEPAFGDFATTDGSAAGQGTLM